ncbi:pleckstrin homology domain-containing family A member 4 [Varanus komodoensis]|uniref:pleckstrin homology domain-containing family A member 4 n=1 Tax=Varanus komodoensis TaxID=61221 RepID=UPI001CF7D85A|nr:pleckstrin homology domain-containing family A member 4 [Varanus komodoensis]
MVDLRVHYFIWGGMTNGAEEDRGFCSTLGAWPRPGRDETRSCWEKRRGGSESRRLRGIGVAGTWRRREKATENRGSGGGKSFAKNVVGFSSANIYRDLQGSALGYLGTMSERDRPKSGLSQASSTVTISSVAMGTKPHSVRPVQKVHTFGKRANSIKRDPNSPVIMRGWLYKKDSSGLKLWKRRWFVLSNYCLFYYRDSREEMVLGSIPLPSYEIRTAFSKEKKNRRFVFKAEHPGMRTYYFSADTQLDMNSWIRAMNQSAVAEGDYGSCRGPHGHSVSTHTSFEDVTLTQDHRARSTESLEIARLSEAREPEASSSESLHLQDSQKGSPCPRRTSLSSSFDGGFHRERIDQPDLSSLSSQTHGCPSPVICAKCSPRPRSPPAPRPCSPAPSSPSRTPQPSPLLSIRSSRSYSLPLTPAESPQILSPAHVHRKPPRVATAQAASCEDLPAGMSPRALVRPNTPMGRVDIAPSEGPPSNPYAVVSPATRGRTLTPADRYDVFPFPEDPYGRRYARSPHPSRARPVGEDSLMASLGRQPQSRFPDRGCLSPSAGPSRALIMSRLQGRLITPHSASSSYLHLPPLPPLPNRPNLGKRTSLGTTGRNLVRERSIHSAGGQRFESDTDAILTKLCGQDKLLRSLEEETGQLRAEKERIEKALEVSRLRMEEFKGQDATMEKISYQQRQLQDELVHLRARLCDLALDSERAWEGYAALENDLQTLKGSLEHIRNVGHPQDQVAAQQDLWRIHDILAGLRASPASYHTLESRRSGISPATSPTPDSHMGANHGSLLPCSGVEESTPSHMPGPEELSRTAAPLEGRQPESPGTMDQAQSPPATSRGQQRAPSQCSQGVRQSPGHSPGDPPAFEKDHGSHIRSHREEAEQSVAKVAPSEGPAPRRSRMSAQEQLDRMQRNQEAKRKSEAAQPGSLGHRRDSLKHGSGRPLPNAPPASSPPKEGAHMEGHKPPRCPPTPEWERQRVIQLSYALAAEASQRGKHLAGRTNSRSSLDDISTSHDSLNCSHLPSDNPPKEPEFPNRVSMHDQTAARNSSCSGTQASAPSQTAIHGSSESSDWSLPLLAEDRRLSSKPRDPHSPSHLLECGRKEHPSLKGPRWVTPLPQSANRNLSVSGTADWSSPPLWDYEVWSSEHSPVGNQGPANGPCLNWRGEHKSHQRVTYLGETGRPIKVTLLKSSF